MKKLTDYLEDRYMYHDLKSLVIKNPIKIIYHSIMFDILLLLLKIILPKEY